MKIEEAVKKMTEGKTLMNEYGGVYKLINKKIYTLNEHDVWVQTAFNIVELCNMHFTLKEEPTLSDKIQCGTVNHRDGNVKEFIEFKDLKHTIEQIKENLFNLNYHEDCVSEIIETIDKHLGPKFKD